MNKKIYEFFLRFIGSEDDSTTQGLYKLFQVALFAIVIVFFINLLSLGKSSFGEWGDFFGGVLNPILTFLTFMGLLITIVIQQKELKEARAEFKRSADALDEQSISMKRQSFENTFFQMLTQHNEIINSIDLVNAETSVTTRGRDCFKVFYNRLAKEYRSNEKKGNGKYSHESIAKLAYKNFWRDHESELAHYFRFLFNFIRFVDESEFKEGLYIKLLRAQLSERELLLLFYNTLTEQGKAFYPYVYEYQLFDNMPKMKILNKDHLELFEKQAYGE
ncbi:putative phage abortive infection protein [Alteromonas oceani]|uniref:Phage abortive infection protein n=1 Tax=Alteromonas oceani TaxID=2071609 RepID=A0ABV7JQE0_9ALTE|nr:putative phage abortive infection protein [Alteromonas oceani]